MELERSKWLRHYTLDHVYHYGPWLFDDWIIPDHVKQTTRNASWYNRKNYEIIAESECYELHERDE